MTLWGTESMTQIQLREDVLTGHHESKTPEHVKKPRCTKNHSTSANMFVTVVPKPGSAAAT